MLITEEDLKRTDIPEKEKVKYICQTCGKVRKQYFFSLKEKPENLKCCPFCNTTKHSKETCLRKYGVSNPAQLESSKQKLKQTCLEKYGVDSFSKTENFLEKYTQTNLERYGTKWTHQNKKIKEKVKQTFLKKYGVPVPIQNKEIKEKIEQTNLKKYGFKVPGKNIHVKEKAKQTCLKRYGVEAPAQNKGIQRKQIETCLKHYGIENYSQTSEARSKSRYIWKWNFEENKKLWLQNCSTKKYTLEEIHFDSKPELCFFLYCRDHNLDIKRNVEKSFSYTYQNKTYYYFPDFEIDGKYYEIKGNQFLTEDNKWQNPFDHAQNDKYEAKHQCALQNNVIILYQKDYQKYIDYIETKYGKDYLKQFKKESD